MHRIPKGLQDYYGYQIRYKQAKMELHYNISGELSYGSHPQWNIENLEYDTVYDIKLVPYRRYDKKLEFGTPYDTVRVKTDSFGKFFKCVL